MKNNIFTKEVYDNLKQKLSKNNEYETLLYLILQVEYGIESDTLFLLKYSQVKFPYIENVKYSYPIKGIIPCYVNIEINSGIMDLIFKTYISNKSTKLFNRNNEYYYEKIFNICGTKIDGRSIQKMRMQYAIWAFNTAEKQYKSNGK